MRENLHAIQLELTTRCNERCVHCYIPHEAKNHDMDSALLLALIDQCGVMGVGQIIFSGGEPMLHPGFLEAVSKAGWEGLKLRIFSNLTLLNDDTLTAFKAFHIHEIQASLYSVDPDIHDGITKMPGSCEATKNAVVKLVENGIPVFISCPVMKQNKRSYTGVLTWAKRIGIRAAPNDMITARSDRSTDNLENRLTIDEAMDVIRDILENDTAYDAERFAPGYHNPGAELPCVRNVCAASLCVNAAGDVLPSPGWNYVLGNLHSQTLQDIWENSPEIKNLQNLSLSDFPKCRNCPDIYFCGMSLEGNANENPAGDFLIIPGHVCELARRTRELVRSWQKTKEGGIPDNDP
ncbi:MAG: radical SAM protein [Spirochaetaceae bacterium]|jgi:radical SAM protein with 4Fe4S-binding SPASM domain|nr:radical SAM protein [Spirochaetaceae bacterium]